MQAKLNANFLIPILKTIKAHMRKIFLILINVLFNNKLCFRLLGGFNKKFNFIGTIFLSYPANEEYANVNSYKWVHQLTPWNPFFIGILIQNGKIGLMFGIPNSESDFHNKKNKSNLIKLLNRTERIRQLTNSPQKTFAGILPGIFIKNRIPYESLEAKITVKAVYKAIEKIQNANKYSKEAPIIFLGGKGFIGRHLVKLFQRGRTHIIDIIDNSNNDETWPALYGKEAMLINLSRQAAIKDYIHFFWKELIVVNEVYPEPSAEELKAITDKNCKVYHVVGIEGKSFPSLPGAYNGAIPCCAGQAIDDFKVVTKQLY